MNLQDGRCRRLALCGVLLLAWAGADAFAQSTRPSNTVPSVAGQTAPIIAEKFISPGSELENQAIRRATPKSNSPTTNATAAVRSQTGIDYGRLLLAMGVVLTLIIILRFVGLRLFPASAQAKATGVIRVLSRSAVAPKQQFLLVQVGGRLIVVADSHTRMTPLTEITDPVEVASIIGQISADQPASISGAFSSLFGKARQKFDSDIEELGKQKLTDDDGKMLFSDDAAEETRSTHRDIQAHDGAAGEPEINAATLELKDLGERVRALAGQIRGK